MNEAEKLKLLLDQIGFDGLTESQKNDLYGLRSSWRTLELQGVPMHEIAKQVGFDAPSLEAVFSKMPADTPADTPAYAINPEVPSPEPADTPPKFEMPDRAFLSLKIDRAVCLIAALLGSYFAWDAKQRGNTRRYRWYTITSAANHVTAFAITLVLRHTSPTPSDEILVNGQPLNAWLTQTGFTIGSQVAETTHTLSERLNALRNR